MVLVAKEKLASDGIAEIVECGLIMPISQTSKHSEQHWADVQTLLHRAITQAGMQPVNVWAGDLKDRVSERIVGNIFRHEVVVADISDLNPNVMLELGLRLASRKPTIVVVEIGGVIPFDIRDFHALQYPGDLNIIGMEKFFSTFSAALKAKFDGYKSNSYKPFLGDVVVDVLEPTTRNVSIENVVIDRLDEISRRISRLEQGKRYYGNALSPVIRSQSSLSTNKRKIYFKGSQILVDGLGELLGARGVEYETAQHKDEVFIQVLVSDPSELSDVVEYAAALGLERASPSSMPALFQV